MAIGRSVKGFSKEMKSGRPTLAPFVLAHRGLRRMIRAIGRLRSVVGGIAGASLPQETRIREYLIDQKGESRERRNSGNIATIDEARWCSSSTKRMGL